MEAHASPFRKEIIAGLTAGALTTLCVHPLDLIKIRLQLLATKRSPSGYSGIFNKIKKSASVPYGQHYRKVTRLYREVYRGLGINLFGNAVAWGLYFALYRATKDLMFQKRHHTSPSSLELSSRGKTMQNDRKLGSMEYLSAGLVSGLVASLLTNPIWVLKTRIMSTSSHDQGSYKSSLNGLRRMLHEEGFRSLWKGLLPSLLGVSQGGIYFMIYDTLKYNVSSLRHIQAEEIAEEMRLKNLETIGITMISKMISVSSVYPLQLLKSNLQSFKAHNKNYTLRSLTRLIYNAEGLQGFYKGLSANLVRALPSTCITFCIYENISYLM